MTLRTAQPQPAMDLNEVDDIPFDFTRDLVAGETITSVAITCAPSSSSRPSRRPARSAGPTGSSGVSTRRAGRAVTAPRR